MRTYARSPNVICSGLTVLNSESTRSIRTATSWQDAMTLGAQASRGELLNFSDTPVSNHIALVQHENVRANLFDNL